MIFYNINSAIIPRFKNLIKSFFMSTPSTKIFSSIWSNENDKTFWFSRSSWSLFFICKWYKKIKHKKTLKIWIPDFFCDESLELIRQLGVEIIFYPIKENSEPLIDLFPQINDVNRPDLFLLVHYFGYPTSTKDVLKFCSNHNSILIEDAAHAMVPIAGIGEAGDFIMYSPHKQFAIPDGAVLVFRKNGPLKLSINDDSIEYLKPIVKESFQESRLFNLNPLIWIFKRSLQSLGFKYFTRPTPFIADQKKYTHQIISPQMSSISKRLLKIELNSLDELKNKRLKCHKDWVATINNIYPSEDVSIFPTNYNPYLFVINTSSSKIAEKIYEDLNSIGVQASAWPDLPPEVSEKEAGAEISIKLRHTRIYLPVHSSIRNNHIFKTSKKIRHLMVSNWNLKYIESAQEWNKLSSNCLYNSLTQSWEYGSAKANAEGWSLKRCVIIDQNNTPIALFQVLLKGLGSLFSIARVNKGPLMLIDEPDKNNRLSLMALQLLQIEARRKRWWFLQVAPLLYHSNKLDNLLTGLSFRKRPNPVMGSALLSLGIIEEDLMKNLNGKWRNCLRKGQKIGVKVELDNDNQSNFDYLIKFYNEQQLNKGFDGISNKMLKALYENQSEYFKFNIFIAREESIITGILVTIQFGNTSEYLIGVTNDKGRKNQSNSVLLWESILEAKRNSCLWYDVGGLDSITPKGIFKFKKGINATPYTLIGEWRKWF
jgi:lipid II:glycine glycyltransferase (peptidoglycan interpeptide bridge formation enzyme)/dTDP-4-amino-4,6-dideoxygalactose transaminase